MCYHLICKPCREKHGGCQWHGAEPREGELAKWAGRTVAKEQWKAEKVKWRDAQPYYAIGQAEKKERDLRQQKSEQDTRDEDKEMQQGVTKDEGPRRSESEGENRGKETAGKEGKLKKAKVKTKHPRRIKRPGSINRGKQRQTKRAMEKSGNA
jgi:hypothetical protein